MYSWRSFANGVGVVVSCAMLSLSRSKDIVRLPQNPRGRREGMSVYVGECRRARCVVSHPCGKISIEPAKRRCDVQRRKRANGTERLAETMATAPGTAYSDVVILPHVLT